MSTAPQVPIPASNAVEPGAVVAGLNAEFLRLTRLTDRIAVVRRALPGRIAFSTSLGIEDQAVIHAIAESGADIDVFTLDTGRHFPETLDTLAATVDRYRIPLRLIAPEASDLEVLVGRDGINGFRASVANRKACCDVRKVRPLIRALAGASGWLTGLRRGQSAGRSNTPFAELDTATGVVKVNPIADWSLEQLNAYVAENGIPTNPLHALGFPSIGCQPCTRAIRPGEDLRAGRWWWENETPEVEGTATDFDGKECGLHANPNRPVIRVAGASVTTPAPTTGPDGAHP